MFISSQRVEVSDFMALLFVRAMVEGHRSLTALKVRLATARRLVALALKGSEIVQLPESEKDIAGVVRFPDNRRRQVHPPRRSSTPINTKRKTTHRSKARSPAPTAVAPAPSAAPAHAVG